MSLKIMHASDLHYCQKHLEWVDRAFGFACETAINAGVDAVVLSGDLFDSSIGLHEPAVDALFSRVRRLSDAGIPVLVLQGTPSHDRPGALAPLRHISDRVLVVDRICQVVLAIDVWIQSHGWKFAPDELNLYGGPIFGCFSLLPSVNRGAVAAAAGAENAGLATGEYVLQLCQAWAEGNEAMRRQGVSTSLVTHGSVSGCQTECATAMVSPDLEFTAGALFAARTSAVMVGHVHSYQEFPDPTAQRIIAYPGSITKLIHGHRGKTGFLIWYVREDGASCEFVEAPSREMIDITFDGPPDMAELARIAETAEGAHIRLRYSVDEEHRHSIDKAGIQAILAGAADIKIEARINPVVAQRSAGIGSRQTLADRLKMWCKATSTESAPLLARLDQLDRSTPDEIVTGWKF